MRRCAVYIVGANSPGNLSSREIRYLVFDELDKYPEFAGREADVVSLAMDRTWSFSPYEKVLEISTPVNEKGPSSYIHNAYLIGDQRKYHIPCPHCAERFVLDFKHYKWDKDLYEEAKVLTNRMEVEVAASTAYIECPACGGRMTEIDRMTAVARAADMPGDGWIATNAGHKPTHASFELPGLISPFLSIEKVVQEFLVAAAQAKVGFLGPLQNVINSIFAQAWTAPPKKTVAQSRIRELSERHPFDLCTIPFDEPCVVFATVDVQAAHLVYAVWAATLTRHAMIDNGYFSTDDELPALRETEYPDKAGKERRVQKVFIDTGYDTMRIYKLCLQYKWLIPIKGEKGTATRQTKPVVPSKIDSFPGGKLFGGRRSFTLYHVHPSFFKDELSASLAEESEVEIMFHREIDQDFIKQMTAEVVRETEPDRFGNTTEYWEKIRVNDYWDCAQYSYAVRHLAHKDMLQMARRYAKSKNEMAT
jgi:phage terminase large subunit GpA-like protein